MAYFASPRSSLGVEVWDDPAWRRGMASVLSELAELTSSPHSTDFANRLIYLNFLSCAFFGL
jgi:hypothetical protein